MTLDSRTNFSAVNTAISLIISLSLGVAALAQAQSERLQIQLAPQQPSQEYPQQTEEEKKAAKELERKAQALIEELVTEAVSLRLAENRVYVLSASAEALWLHDKERSLALIREAIAQVVAQAREAKEKAARDEGQLFDPRYARQNDTFYLRNVIMNFLASRDPGMALEFVQTMRALRPAEGRNPGEEQQEKALELNLAVQIAETDPQKALQIAEEYLNGKPDYQLLNLWNALQRKDPKAAAPLTERILNYLNSQDILSDYEPLNLTFGVLGQMRSRLAEIANAQNQPDSSNAAQTNSAEIQQAYRAALDLVAAAALKITVNNWINPQEADRSRNLIMQIQSYLPDIEKFLPSRIAAVRAKVAQLDAAIFRSPYERLYAGYGIDLNTKPVQDLLALATKAPPEIRQNLYQQIVWKAMGSGDDETARRIIQENIPDKWQANDMLSNLERRSADRAIGEGKYADARKLLAKMRTDEQRATALAGWAMSAINKGDQKSAREMTQEARALIGSRFQRNDQLEAQIAIANVALSFDPDASFEIAEAAIDRLNRLVAANYELQTYGGMDEGELQIVNGGSGYTGSAVQLLAVLARKDFDRAAALLKRWQATEIRLMMSLSVAQNILTARGAGDDVSSGYGVRGGSGNIMRSARPAPPPRRP
jgi:hypothetical protein